MRATCNACLWGLVRLLVVEQVVRSMAVHLLRKTMKHLFQDAARSRQQRKRHNSNNHNNKHNRSSNNSSSSSIAPVSLRT